MANADQKMRLAAQRNPSMWNGSLDKEHCSRMKEIVKKIGWPTQKIVGAESSNMAWLIVQHCDFDIAFQKYCLKLMEKCSVDDIDTQNIAYLTDRIRINLGEKQVFGTQLRQENGKLVPAPIEKVGEVNRRRRKLGMKPLEEYIQKSNRFLKTIN